jgi:hypothetical protein
LPAIGRDRSPVPLGRGVDDGEDRLTLAFVRFAYLDNLKVLLVVGVIAVHTAIIYGVEGSFYLEDYESMGDVTAGVLTVFTAVGFLFACLGSFGITSLAIRVHGVARVVGSGPRPQPA